MRKRIWLGLAGTLMIWHPFNTAHAVEVLSAQELAAHCSFLAGNREGVDGQSCIRYIQGFIDGAVATDVRVMNNIEAEMKRTETYSERAMRTRVHDIQRAAGYAEFCLGDPVPLSEVVDKIAADLNTREIRAPELEARQFVYAALRRHYPCKAPGSGR